MQKNVVRIRLLTYAASFGLCLTQPTSTEQKKRAFACSASSVTNLGRRNPNFYPAFSMRGNDATKNFLCARPFRRFFFPWITFLEGDRRARSDGIDARGSLGVPLF